MSDTTSPSPPPPPPPAYKITLDEAKRDVGTDAPRSFRLEEDYITRHRRESIKAEGEYQRLQGLKDHFEHKKKWSWMLLGALVLMILFQMVLLVLVGSNVLDFTEYDWLLPAVLIQYLTQIVGLAVFVVRSLFSDPN